jgi:hypothetical protein
LGTFLRVSDLSSCYLRAAGAFECPARIDEARNGVQKAAAARDNAKAASKAKDMLTHAEAEHKGRARAR